MRPTWRVMLGRAKAELGDAAEGVELINQALVGFANAGAKVAITYFLTLLSQAQALAGDTELASALSTALWRQTPRVDLARIHPDPAGRAQAQGRTDGRSGG